MNLLKSLQQAQTQRAAQPVPGQAANLRKMLASKSGKAGATTGPAISGIQEQQALKDLETQATTQQQAAQIDVGQQQQAQAAQTQAQTQAQQRLSTQRQQTQQQFDQQVEKVSNNLQRFKNELESREGKQSLSEALFTRQMADRKFMEDLQRAGIERRLGNTQAFSLEAGKAAFGRAKEMFESDQAFREAMDMDDAEYRREMANMGIDTARSILNDSMEAANRQSMWSALGSFGSTAIQAGTIEFETGETGTDGKPTKTTFFKQMTE